MKNRIITSYFILLSIATLLSLYIPKNEVTAKEEIIIPNEAIRLRILANSDSEHDQALKRKVRDAVNAEITNWVQELTSIDDARVIIQSRLPEIQTIAEEIVEDENANQTVQAEFGNVEFPTKLYGQFLYPAGEYEAILITLGEGEGANWWCVLFPPLCFLDFSNGVAISNGFDEEDKKAKKAAKKKQKAEDIQQDTEKITPQQQELKSEKSTQSEITSTQNTATETDTFDSEQQNANYQTDETFDQSTEDTTKNETNRNKAENNEDSTENSTPKKSKSRQTAEAKNKKAPVYTEEDEQEVVVRFFIKDLWTKFFG